MIEVLMQVHKDKDIPTLPEGLDLVEEEQIIHEIQLDEELKVEEGLSTVSYLLHQHSFK